MDGASLADFIRTQLDLRAVPFAPALRLYTAHPGSRLSRLAGGTAPPYWAHPWPGGMALAQHVLARPEVVSGRRVLDLGAGSGLVGIAAAKAGASAVLCCDTDPSAREACRVNALANGVSVETTGDLPAAALPDVDLVCAGDLFYDPRVAAGALEILHLFQARQTEILVGDIGRRYLPRDELEAIAGYPVRDVGSSLQEPAPIATVYRVRPPIPRRP